MYFITGTDTNIGKTFIASLLTYKLKAHYFKPIQAGDLDVGGDTASVKNMTQLPDSYFHNPIYNLKHPLSPHEAAKRENIHIDSQKIFDYIQKIDHKHIIIEGAGGLMVPINENEYIIDLIKKIGFEVILVTKSTLGTINHTLLSITALERYNIPIKGIIINGEPHPHNRQAIEQYGKYPILGEIPIIKNREAYHPKYYIDHITL